MDEEEDLINIKKKQKNITDKKENLTSIKKKYKKFKN